MRQPDFNKRREHSTRPVCYARRGPLAVRPCFRLHSRHVTDIGIGIIGFAMLVRVPIFEDTCRIFSTSPFPCHEQLAEVTTLTMSAKPRVIKSVFNGDMRRINPEALTCLEKLKEHISHLYKLLPESQFALKYEDNEGDFVTM